MDKQITYQLKNVMIQSKHTMLVLAYGHFFSVRARAYMYFHSTNNLGNWNNSSKLLNDWASCFPNINFIWHSFFIYLFWRLIGQFKCLMTNILDTCFFLFAIFNTCDRQCEISQCMNEGWAWILWSLIKNHFDMELRSIYPFIKT